MVFRETSDHVVDFLQLAELMEIRALPLSHFIVIHTLAEYQPNCIHYTKAFSESLEPIVDFLQLAELMEIRTLPFSHFIEIHT